MSLLYHVGLVAFCSSDDDLCAQRRLDSCGHHSTNTDWFRTTCVLRLRSGRLEQFATVATHRDLAFCIL